MHNGTSDTAHVLALPPLIYGAAFIIGLLLHVAFPLHVLPTTLARGIGVVCVLVSLPLALATLRVLSRAHTPVDPLKPTTALVTEGRCR
jgi:protein-S-isoprenylcysteine O-methyltransferase Ste14